MINGGILPVVIPICIVGIGKQCVGAGHALLIYTCEFAFAQALEESRIYFSDFVTEK